MRIYLVGFMGAGKTFCGALLAKKLEVPFFDLDQLIEAAQQKSINTIFEAEGEAAFRQYENEELYRISAAHDNMVLSCGGGAPCYHSNMEYMNLHGITVWLKTPPKILVGRLRQQQNKRPLLKNMNDEDLKNYIITKNAERAAFYNQAKVIIEDHNISIENLIKHISYA